MKTTKKDPILKLVKTREYIKGYNDGKLAYARYFNSLLVKVQQLETIILSVLDEKTTKQPVKIYGISSGGILLNEKFASKDKAWNRIYEICGNKIDIRKSPFKVIRL